MTTALKIFLIFVLLFIGFRMITKPFRDLMAQVKKQNEINNKRYKKPEGEKRSKTEDVGEYIDYEEVD